MVPQWARGREAATNWPGGGAERTLASWKRGGMTAVRGRRVGGHGLLSGVVREGAEDVYGGGAGGEHVPGLTQQPHTC